MKNGITRSVKKNNNRRCMVHVSVATLSIFSRLRVADNFLIGASPLMLFVRKAPDRISL